MTFTDLLPIRAGGSGGREVVFDDPLRATRTTLVDNDARRDEMAGRGGPAMNVITVCERHALTVL